MRRMGLIVLTLCLALGLTACGGEKEEQITNLDAEAAAQAFLDSGCFSETLEQLDLDMAFRLYGLEEAGLTEESVLDCAVWFSAGATAEEVAVLVLDSEQSAETARDALEAHVDSQKESYQDYLPQEVPKLDNAQLTVYGNSVVLVVPAEVDPARNLMDNLSDYHAD